MVNNLFVHIYLIYHCFIAISYVILIIFYVLITFSYILISIFYVLITISYVIFPIISSVILPIIYDHIILIDMML